MVKFELCIRITWSDKNKIARARLPASHSVGPGWEENFVSNKLTSAVLLLRGEPHFKKHSFQDSFALRSLPRA